MAAHEMIVDGLAAVAASPVTNALLGVADLLDRLHAGAGAGPPHGAGAQVDQEAGAHEAETDPEPGDLEQARGAGHAEGGVGGVDQRGGGADGQAGGDATPQHRAGAEQPDRAHLGGHQGRGRTGGEGGEHGRQSRPLRAWRTSRFL